MKKLLFSLTILMFASSSLVRLSAAADNPQTEFQDANKAYEQGKFDDALQRYSSLAGRDFSGLALAYNLGNVYFRRGERGKAVLWYERALRLAPRDSDVRFNLSLARSHIKTEGDGVVKRALTAFTSSELATAASAASFLFFGLLGLLALGKLRGEVLPAMSLSITGFAVVAAGAWLGMAIYLEQQPVAVVVSPPGEVRNGPGADYAVGFTIPDGSQVVVLNQRPDWTQVGVPEQGLKGWMPAAEIELVQPRATF